MGTIAIIGAGPAGLMAAEILAQAGHGVTVYDRMQTPARKFLMAGRGGLNLTHSEPLDKFLTRYGAAQQWLAPYITAFPPEALRAWCEGLGQETFVGSSGRVFPRAMKAAPLLRAWLRRLDGYGVRFMPSYTWRGWENDRLVFETPDKQKYWVKADATLLALGGASWPRLGSAGSWVDILEREGVPIAPLQPANCGFTVEWSEYFRTRFSGQPLKPVSITCDDVTRRGEAIVTATGLEGGAVYTLSTQLRQAIANHGKAEVTLDLRPGMTVDALAEKLKATRGRQSFSNYLKRAGISPLLMALLREVATQERLNNSSPHELARLFKSFPLTFTGTAGMARAISSAGGIKREAVDAYFKLPGDAGVFVAGEMLDWEAPTGGYLLQACFSTAVAAAEGIKRLLVL